ncbi:MAG: agmatinase [Cyanobacteria bacterium P01_A01_bin.135]
MTPSSLTSPPDLLNFLGNEVSQPLAAARVVVLPIPFEATTTYRKGCVNGPAAILNASHQVEYYDDEWEQEFWPVGIYTHPPIADSRRSSAEALTPEVMMEQVQQVAADLIRTGKFVIALGGEHSITVGLVAAYQQTTSEPFTVVQIDAHSDLRHSYEGSIYNHACVMRRVVDRGVPTVHVGIRSLCQEEATLIRDRRLPVFWGRQLAQQPQWGEQVVTAIPTQRVFLTIDLDGLDPSLMPGVGTPEPGGLSWYGLLGFLRQLFAAKTIIGADVMELAPLTDSVVSQFTAAKLTYKLVGYQAVAQGWLR